MTTLSLPLPGNVLHESPQTLNFDKIATFIGGNGSGKSTILKSIFDEKLKGTSYQDHKVVCFSSGQNESYSNDFGKYLNSERAKKSALNLDCFYYDKLWSMLLIFLATTGKPDGLVRQFLKQHGYVVESEFDEDESTQISFDVKVESSYINLVEKSKEDEEKGEADVRTSKAYHRTLFNFINTLVVDNYEFDAPLVKQNVQLNQDKISNVSFETDEKSSFDSKVMFFTQAADNNFFIDKDSFKLTFKKEEVALSLDDLSDGEYQLLFLYALIDLFDSENTLFLLDEADSHLHYKNIENLWGSFAGIHGSVITTTHLLDSITKSGIARLRVIESGQVKPASDLKYLTDRLRDLSELNDVKFQALSLFENVVLIDDENDWEQFKLLVIQKLGDSEEERLLIENMLARFIAVKCPSGYEGKQKEEFALKKRCWVDNFSAYLNGHSHNTKNIFLICDRDELSLSAIGTEKCELLVQGIDVNTSISSLSGHILSWKRREIKHYLLSYTGLIDNIDEINDELDLTDKSKLCGGASGDYKTDGQYNDQLAALKSTPVKGIVDPHINSNVEGQGFCIDKAQAYVSRIPKDEISEDIANMYKYLAGENE